MTALDVMWVGIGGGIGAIIRWLAGVLTAARYKGPFPLATFMINITGAFVIAYLATHFGVSWKDRYGDVMIALVLTGVLGGYTTFSSMQLDALKVSENGRPGLAFIYLVGSSVLGILAAGAGVFLANA